MDDDDIFGPTSTNTNPIQKSTPIDDPLGFTFDPSPIQHPPKKEQTNNNDPFGLLDLNMGGSPPPNIVNQPKNQGGFDFLGMGTSSPQPQQTNLMGEDFFGVQPQQIAPQHNPNSFKAYSNDQMEIWMECIKESPDATKIIATYHNKTQSLIDNLFLQVAVLKHLKLTINPLNSTQMQPLSKGAVNQVTIFLYSEYEHR